MQVFLSVGRVPTNTHKRFLDRLDERLRNRGIESRTIGRNTFTAGQPLEKIEDEIRKSHGLLVLAMRRTEFSQGGVEYTAPDQPPTAIASRVYATPWHQIELAMARMLKLPTLVILERGIYEEGLLEDKYGWYVYRTDVSQSAFDKEEFVGILDDWCQRVKSTTAAPVKTFGDSWTIGDILRALKPAGLWQLFGALATMLAALFTLGAWAQAKGLVGTGESPVKVAPSVGAPGGSTVPIPPPPQEPSTPALSAAERFLQAIDTGDPHQSWLLLSEFGRSLVSNDEQQWRSLYTNNITPLGKLKTRKFIRTETTQSLSGFPPGTYRAFTFESEYKKRTMKETVLVHTEHGNWAIAMFSIIP